MYTKVVSVVSDSSYGPLFKYSADYAIDIYNKHIQEMLTQDWTSDAIIKLRNERKSSFFTFSKDYAIMLSRYKELVDERSNLYKKAYGKDIDVEVVVQEKKKMGCILKDTIKSLEIDLLLFNNSDVTGLYLDKQSIERLETVIVALKSEFQFLIEDLKKYYSKRIITMLDDEDGLVNSKNNTEQENEEEENTKITKNPSTEPVIILKNASEEERKKIANIFIRLKHRIRFLNAKGEFIYHRADVKRVLSNYTYFLETSNGLKPFKNLDSVVEHLCLSEEKLWRNVVKFQTILMQDWYINKQKNELAFRESVRRYPIVSD